eukprot:Opistho-2@29436
MKFEKERPMKMPLPYSTAPTFYVRRLATPDGSASDSDTEKRTAQLEKNRLAARVSRQRRKEYVTTLEERARELELNNETLFRELHELKKWICFRFPQVAAAADPDGQARAHLESQGIHLNGSIQHAPMPFLHKDESMEADDEECDDGDASSDSSAVNDQDIVLAQL